MKNRGNNALNIAISIFIRFVILFFGLWLASIGTAMVYKSLMLGHYGETAIGNVAFVDATRDCLIPPHYQCSLVKGTFQANGRLYNFSQDMHEPVSIYSTVQIAYLERHPNVNDVIGDIASTTRLGIVTLIIGFVILVLTKPIAVFRAFTKTFAYGILPILYPKKSKYIKTPIGRTIGIVGLGAVCVLFLWIMSHGAILFGLFWLPIVITLTLFYTSFFGFTSISPPSINLSFMMLGIYLYVLLAYVLVYG